MTDPVQAIAGYLDGRLDPAGADELALAIRSDPAIADAVSAIMMLDMHLRERTCCASVVKSTSRPSPISGRIVDDRLLWAGALVAAMLFVSVTIGIVLTTTRPEPTPAAAPVASVVFADEVMWDSEPARIGEDIPGDRVAIAAGELEMMLRSGAQVNLSGATEVWMPDPMRVALRSGRARFVCPQSAVGFTVELPNGAKIEDLGTDFELRVDDSGRARLFVHQGRVATTDSIGTRSTLDAGYGLAFDPAGHPVDVDSDPWLRRRSAIGAMRRDPSMGAMVDPTSVDAKGIELHGAAVLREGADDAALGFAGGGAYAELTGLSVEGSLTLTAWIKPARVDPLFSAILMTPSWLPGGVHLQLMGDRLKLNLHDAVELAADTPIVTDRWQHVAATVDESAGLARLYVDGEPAGSAPLAGTSSHIDRATVGAWRSTPAASAASFDRSFTGEMRDVLVLGRSMSGEEIRGLYESTGPEAGPYLGDQP